MARSAVAAKKQPAKKSPAERAVRKKTATRSNEPKTRATAASVPAFVAKVDAKRRDDVRALDALFSRVVGEPGKMWGSSIIGYGSQHLRYATGRELDWPLVAFSPRATSLTLYLEQAFAGRDTMLARLGPHSTGKSCVYIKRLADVDGKVLEDLVRASVAASRAR